MSVITQMWLWPSCFAVLSSTCKTVGIVVGSVGGACMNGRYGLVASWWTDTGRPRKPLTSGSVHTGGFLD